MDCDTQKGMTTPKTMEECKQAAQAAGYGVGGCGHDFEVDHDVAGLGCYRVTQSWELQDNKGPCYGKAFWSSNGNPTESMGGRRRHGSWVSYQNNRKKGQYARVRVCGKKGDTTRA